MKAGCIPGCIACRTGLPEGHDRRDIVQVQKESWEQIAREEREGKRRPPIMRLAAQNA